VHKLYNAQRLEFFFSRCIKEVGDLVITVQSKSVFICDKLFTMTTSGNI